MEPAIDLTPAEAHAPEFPAMRGMAVTAAPRPQQPRVPMRAMAQVPTLQPQPSHGGMAAVSVSAYQGQTGALTEPHFVDGKNPSVATLLSVIFPGGGQFYNGDTKKGFAVLALAVLASCLTLYAGIPLLGVPLSLGVWVWSFLDAGKVARRQKAVW